MRHRIFTLAGSLLVVFLLVALITLLVHEKQLNNSLQDTNKELISYKAQVENQKDEEVKLKEDNDKLKINIKSLNEANSSLSSNLSETKNLLEKYKQNSGKEPENIVKVNYIMVDNNLDTSLIDMIIKHFNAAQNIDQAEFSETITKNYWNVNFSDKNKLSDLKDMQIFPNAGALYNIKRVEAVSPESIKNETFFIHVIMADGKAYYPAVMKENGEWKVAAYD